MKRKIGEAGAQAGEKAGVQAGEKAGAQGGEEGVSPGALTFDEFVRSIPGDVDVRVSLKRLPSPDLHPLLRGPEAVFPAPQISTFDEMVEEVARTHGPGMYSMAVRCWHPGTNERRLIKTVQFRIGAAPPVGGQASDQAAGLQAGEPGDSMEDVRAALSRAAVLRAQAVELETAAKFAGLGTAPAPQMDVLKTVSELIQVLRPVVQPPAPPPGSAGEMVAALREVIQFGREIGGDGRPTSVWEILLPHLLDLLKELGPYLPGLVAALRGQMGTPGPSAAAPAGPASDATPNPPTLPAGSGAEVVSPPSALVAATGDAAHAQTLHHLLALAWLEMGQPRERWGESWDRFADLCEAHAPGMLAELVRLPVDQFCDLWRRWDSRVAEETGRLDWIKGLHATLSSEGGKGTPA